MTPALKIQKRADGKLNISGLAMWSTGTFHGHGSPPEGDEFKADDLDEMVRAHTAIGSKLRPRMYAGHPISPTLKMLARPQGEIKTLYRDGNMLLGDLEGVDPVFWEKAQTDGARLSPDVKLGHRDQETGVMYPLTVVGLGVLGAVQPANQFLPALDTYHITHYSDAAQHRAYGEPGNIRSYTGMKLPGNDAASSPLATVLHALRALTAITEDSK